MPSPQSNTDSFADQLIADGIEPKPARIMAAGLHLFARQGYAGTSVRDIVDAADVTNPMLYYYFDNKQGLFTALLEHLFDSIAADVTQILERPRSIDDTLDAIAAAYFEACHDFPDALRFVYAVLYSPQQSRPDFALPDAYQTMLMAIQRRMEIAIDQGELTPPDGFDATFLTERFMGLVDNQLMGAFSLISRGQSWHPSRHELDDYIGPRARAQLLDFFFAGAGLAATEDSP